MCMDKKILLKSNTLSIVCKICLNLQAVSLVKANILYQNKYPFDAYSYVDDFL